MSKRITKYVALDVETGGLDDRVHSLLQVGAVEVLPDLRPGRWVELSVCENPLVVTPGAMAVNKIDVRELDPEEHNPEKVAFALSEFFWAIGSPSDGVPAIGVVQLPVDIVLVNWNVGFDYRFLRRLPLDRYLGDVRLSYRTIDVASAWNYRMVETAESPNGMHDVSQKCGVKQNDDFLPSDYNGHPHRGVYDACEALAILRWITNAPR